MHETLNWICLAGAMEGRVPKIRAYSESYILNSNNTVVLFRVNAEFPAAVQ